MYWMLFAAAYYVFGFIFVMRRYAGPGMTLPALFGLAAIWPVLLAGEAWEVFTVWRDGRE